MAGDASGAEEALRIQVGRLRVVDLLPETSDQTGSVCPMCSQTAQSVIPSIEHLRRVRDEVRRELSGVAAAPAALSAARKELEAQLVSTRQRLIEVELQLKEIRSVPDSNASADAVRSAQEQHLGAIRFFIEHWPDGSADVGALANEYAEAERHLEELRTELQEYDRGDRLQFALGSIAGRMTELAKELNLERPGSPLLLDIKRLTVVRQAPNGKPERLPEIGGGANHVGYHLCALFALHWYFLKRDRPVPSFLFIDQPSQVYFPEESNAGVGQEERQTDWDSVRQLYAMIFRAAEQLEGRLQVIVLDHAFFLDEEFRGAVRKRWRNGENFI